MAKTNNNNNNKKAKKQKTHSSILLPLLLSGLAVVLISSSIGTVVLQSAEAQSIAKQFAPGQQAKLYPTDPINPGASQFAPGQYPVDPVIPGQVQKDIRED